MLLTPPEAIGYFALSDRRAFVDLTKTIPQGSLTGITNS